MPQVFVSPNCEKKVLDEEEYTRVVAGPNEVRTHLVCPEGGEKKQSEKKPAYGITGLHRA